MIVSMINAGVGGTVVMRTPGECHGDDGQPKTPEGG
jgi:hypothetical protein